MKTEYTIKISKKIKATISIISGGQTPPNIGDDVVVILRIGLPANSNNSLPRLHKELVFGEKVKIFSSPLYETWGSFSSDEKSVVDEIKIAGRTWKEAKRKAALMAINELNKLIPLTRKRNKALKNAGSWEC